MPQYEAKIPAAPEHSYTIEIGVDLLPGLWQRIEAAYPDRSKFVVTDADLVSAGHLEKLLASQRVPTYVISPAGETSKNIDTVVAIIETMEKACLGRDSLIAALGGGTVGDIAAFAASIFKRGVPVVQIPTTTVAQADSAIGGKTGVDSSLSKNAFGTFWHPAAVYIDVATLATLDDRQYRAGLVESIKHALIADKTYFQLLRDNVRALLDRDPELLQQLALYNCRIKGHIVQADPTENNLRRILNYGHTIGHAVEAASGYQLLHGEAVAIGIIAAGLIEQKLSLAETHRLKNIRELFQKLDLPLKLPAGLSEDVLIERLRHDKKAVKTRPRFVLLEEIGRVHVSDGQYAVEVEPSIVRDVIKQLAQE